MRIIALDIGEKRVGVAISDPDERVATPLCVLAATDIEQNAKPWRRVLDDWRPEAMVCGLPLSLNGEEGPQAQRVRQIAEKVATQLSLPLFFTDERLSSTEAKRSLREKGFSEKAMRGKVDMIAASIFLQAWLDARCTHEKDSATL